MPVSIGDKLRIAAFLEGPDGVIQNTFHFQVEGINGSLTDVLAVSQLGEWLEDMYSLLVPHQSNTVSYGGYDVFNETTGQPVGGASFPTLTVGGSALNPIPSGCAAMVRGDLGLSKREGRKYFGGFSEGANTGDARIDPTTITSLGLAGGEWRAAFTRSPDGIVGRGTVRTTSGLGGAPVYRPINAIIVDDAWDYQRRRRTGRGI